MHQVSLNGLLATACPLRKRLALSRVFTCIAFTGLDRTTDLTPRPISSLISNLEHFKHLVVLNEQTEPLIQVAVKVLDIELFLCVEIIRVLYPIESSPKKVIVAS